jgi:hypothetical protein
MILKCPIQIRGSPPKWFLLVTASAVGLEELAGQQRSHKFEPQQIQQELIEWDVPQFAQGDRVNSELAN